MRSALLFVFFSWVLAFEVTLALPMAYGTDNIVGINRSDLHVRAPQANGADHLRCKYGCLPPTGHSKRNSSLTDEEKEQQRSDKRIQNNAERINNRLNQGIQDITDAGVPGNITTCDDDDSVADGDVALACKRIGKKFRGGLERMKADSLPLNTSTPASEPLSDDPSDPNVSPFLGNRLGTDVIASGVCDNTQPAACDALRTIAQNSEAF